MNEVRDQALCSLGIAPRRDEVTRRVSVSFLFVVLLFFVVKKPAFECRLNEVEIQRVIATLQQWIEKHSDIRIYPVCQTCM